MGYTVITPQNSFVRFDGEHSVTHCVHGTFTQCLPVYTEDDVYFQFVVQADTEEEAGALCSPYSNIRVGLVTDCNQEDFTVEFEEVPDRFKISDLQVLYNWSHGFPGMFGGIGIEECFYIRVIVDDVNYCSNCFQRIPNDCFTSVVEYGNDENFAGFNYCNAGAIDSGGELDCNPEIYEFTNQSEMTIPYTQSLIDRFGQVPTVQAWIYVGSELTNVGIVATFDAMPPTQIHFDFGGVSSGIIIIR